MKTIHTPWIVVLCLGLGSFATADSIEGTVPVYDRERGELSIGTSAPTRAGMLAAIENPNMSTRLFATLEYGERVECHECVPGLQRMLLEDANPKNREIAAWWLRRRPFAIGAIMNRMRVTLETDSDPVRRARAAEAIGEFLDPNGFDTLETAASDDDATVRAAAVKALGRLNHPSSGTVIATALADSNADVRSAALASVSKVTFFTESDAVVPTLGDAEADIRRRGALLVGQLEVESAVSDLSALLASDTDRDVRQAAAWSLGKIGGSDARSALASAVDTETDRLVLDAIEIARQM